MTTEPLNADSAPVPQYATAPARASLPYLPVLDGVRGLAILLVLVHHLLWIEDVPIPRGVKAFGDSLFVGVDLFFVLSGFLITRILLQARGEPHYFRNFYIRRTLRIFPLYYAFLLAMLLFWVVGGRVLHLEILKPADSLSVFPWVTFFAGNILIVVQSAPLATAMNPLWSLSVEEHFYMVWPTLVRFVAPRRMLYVCAGIIAGTLGLRFGTIALFAHLNRPLPASTLSYFTLFRVDALAMGAAVAIMFYLNFSPRFLTKAALVVLAASGAALVGNGIIRGGLNYYINRDAAWMYSALALFFGAGLALVVLHPRTMAARFLGTGFMRFFGKYSYGMYIFNLPVWVYLGRAFSAQSLHGWQGWQVILLRASLAVVLIPSLSLLSWNLLEKRCLKLKARFEPRGVEA